VFCNTIPPEADKLEPTRMTISDIAGTGGSQCTRSVDTGKALAAVRARDSENEMMELLDDD